MLKIALVTIRHVDLSIGLGYLVSYYRKYGKFNKEVDFEIIECPSSFNNPIESKEDVLKKLKDSDLAGFSTVTQDYSLILEIAKRAKRDYAIPLIFGGYHISALPHTLPEFVDIGVIGEGEITFMELLDKYIQKGNFYHEWLKDIRGIVYHRGTQIEITESRPFIEHLDMIPPPARDIFDKRYLFPRLNASFYRKQGGEVLGRISTSRGCLFNCIFCYASKFWRNKIRYFSAEYVVSEIRLLIDKYGCDSIHINDDLFIGNVVRLKEIVRLIEKEGISADVEFTFIQARTDMFSEEVCQLLKRMNVRTIGFGIESGSDKILSYLKNNTVTVSQNWEAVNRALKWGFSVWPQLIVGSPGETREDIEKTLRFTRIKDIPRYQIAILTPYPGTELWHYAEKKGLVSEDMDFKRSALVIKKGELEDKVYLGDRLTLEELWQMIKEAFEEEGQRKQADIKINLKKDYLRYFVRYLKVFFAKPHKYIPWAMAILNNRLKKAL